MFLLPHVPLDAWRRKNVAIDLIFFLNTPCAFFFFLSEYGMAIHGLRGLPRVRVRLILDSNRVRRVRVHLILDSNGVPRAWVRLILDSNGVRRVRVRLIGVSNNKSKYSLVNI